jgi:hypothetical protein
MINLICNKCGKKTEIEEFNSTALITSMNLHHNFKIRFKYPSQYDLLEGNLCLCEKCLCEIINSCNVPINFFENIPLDKIVSN